MSNSAVINGDERSIPSVFDWPDVDEETSEESPTTSILARGKLLMSNKVLSRIPFVRAIPFLSLSLSSGHVWYSRGRKENSLSRLSSLTSSSSLEWVLSATQHRWRMKFFFRLLLLVGLCPMFLDSIRCYKCDATDRCRSIRDGYTSRHHDESSDSLEIIDCEHYCWKSVSLGNLVQSCCRWALLLSLFRTCLSRMCKETLCYLPFDGVILEQCLLSDWLLQSIQSLVDLLACFSSRSPWPWCPMLSVRGISHRCVIEKNEKLEFNSYW